MSRPKPASPAKLIIGVILNDKMLLNTLGEELVGLFGEIDAISPWFDFDFTHYYEKEMGKHLYRRMLAFKSLIHQEDLSDIKIATNRIELRMANEGNRPVNIDPGYLLLERFVLATGKNFSHRIYIGKGIYADLTLIYSKGGFQKLDWTYPDYAQSDLQAYLLKVREKYRRDLSSIASTDVRANGEITN